MFSAFLDQDQHTVARILRVALSTQPSDLFLEQRRDGIAYISFHFHRDTSCSAEGRDYSQAQVRAHQAVVDFRREILAQTRYSRGLRGFAAPRPSSLSQRII